jgi:hypothetical protein
MVTRVMVNLFTCETESRETVLNIINMLVPGALQANYKQSLRYVSEGYAIDMNEVGIDFGSSSESAFASLLRNAIDDRFAPTGHKIYYPDAVYSSERLYDYFSGIEGGYIDDSELPALRPKKWLYNQVSKYISWCKSRGYISVGIIPWKLFKINYIPMIKDSEFLNKHKDAIYAAVQKVEDIRKAGRESPDKLKEEYDKAFPARVYKRRATAEPMSNVKNMSAETLDEFLNGIMV